MLYLDGDGRQRIVELDGALLAIGRRPSSEIVLEWDTEASRAHALLERVGAEWTLVDDGLSRNGSYVNGERVRARRRLADGDAITVGRAAPRARRAVPAVPRGRVRRPAVQPPDRRG